MEKKQEVARAKIEQAAELEKLHKENTRLKVNEACYALTENLNRDYRPREAAAVQLAEMKLRGDIAIDHELDVRQRLADTEKSVQERFRFKFDMDMVPAVSAAESALRKQLKEHHAQEVAIKVQSTKTEVERDLHQLYQRQMNERLVEMENDAKDTRKADAATHAGEAPRRN